MIFHMRMSHLRPVKYYARHVELEKWTWQPVAQNSLVSNSGGRGFLSLPRDLLS